MDRELKTGRAEALCDGIFAIAMTLMIVGFDDMVNWPKTLSENDLRVAIFGMLPDLAYYMQSFIILGAFWIEHHHQFHFIKHTDLKLLSLNIFALMFVALIPFTTLIVGDYGHMRIAALLFEANLLCAGLLFYAHWRYAVKKPGMTDSGLDRNTLEFYSRKNLVIPVISVIAICISLLKPHVGSSLYFLAPFIVFLQRGRRKEA